MLAPSSNPHHIGFMKWVGSFLLPCLCACGPQFAVVPKGGLQQITATAPEGPSLTAFANQWGGDPYDLADYVTPVAVEVSNPGPSEIRVAYSDFVLTDPSGFRYPAINPFWTAQLGALPPPTHWLAALQVVVPPPPSRGGGGGGGPAPGRYIGPPGGGYHPYTGPSGGWRRSYGAPSYSWRPYTHNYYIYGGLRGYYGGGALYWGGPFVYPPYYSTWVYGWGPGYYYQPRPSADILGYALPEGVLPPGGKAAGFIYFQNATRSGNRELHLRWNATDARSGNLIGASEIPLEVFER